MKRAAATTFSTISFCGDDAFLLRLNLFRASQERVNSKSRENLIQHQNLNRKIARHLPNFHQFRPLKTRKLLKALSTSTVIILLTPFSEYGQK